MNEVEGNHKDSICEELKLLIERAEASGDRNTTMFLAFAAVAIKTSQPQRIITAAVAQMPAAQEVLRMLAELSNEEP